MYPPMQQAPRWILAPAVCNPVDIPEKEVNTKVDESPTARVPVFRSRSERYSTLPCTDVIIDRDVWNALVTKLPPGKYLTFSFGRLGTVLVDKVLTGRVADGRPRMSLANFIVGYAAHARVAVQFLNGDHLDFRRENLLVTSTANTRSHHPKI